MGRLYRVVEAYPRSLRHELIRGLEALAAREPAELDHVRLWVRKGFFGRFSLEVQWVCWHETLVERAKARDAETLHREWEQAILPRLARRVAGGRAPLRVAT